jgi:hypothetical protein
VRPEQTRAFLQLNEDFARPVGASPAKQWSRVRGREVIELLTPRVTGAWFEENQQLSQQRAYAVIRRGVQARIQARQQHTAERAEQQRARVLASRTHQRLNLSRGGRDGLCPPAGRMPMPRRVCAARPRSPAFRPERRARTRPGTP